MGIVGEVVQDRFEKLRHWLGRKIEGEYKLLRDESYEFKVRRSVYEGAARLVACRGGDAWRAADAVRDFYTYVARGHDRPNYEYWSAMYSFLLEQEEMPDKTPIIEEDADSGWPPAAAETLFRDVLERAE